MEIKVFPHDGNIWRLDWIGNLFFSRGKRDKSPFINARLSRFETTFPYPLKGQRRIPIPIGLLPMVSIGTLWESGKLVGTQYCNEEVFDVVSDKEMTRLAKSGVTDDHDNYLIPFNIHPYHRMHTNSWCLVAQTGCKRTVIIPAIEIIRFYFGSSSELIVRIFQAPFDTNNLWENARIDKSNGIAHVDISPGLRGYSAADIARIAFDPYAERCIQSLSSSLLASSIDEIYPMAKLPFEGKSTIKVNGMWLGDQKFLVFQIISCSHPFPFEKLTYTMASKMFGSAAASAKGGAEDDQGPGEIDDKTTLNLHEEPPDQALQPKEVPVSYTARFPDLLTKKIYRTDPQEGVAVFSGRNPSTEASVVQGEGKNDLLPIDIIAFGNLSFPDHYPPENPKFTEYLKKFVSGLSDDFNTISFVALNPRQLHPQISKMPKAILDDDTVHPLSTILGSSHKPRPRYVSVIKIDGIISSNAYLFIEADPIEHPLGAIIIEAEPCAKMDCEWVATILSDWKNGNT
ncbi:hypothetical protein SAMN02949497_2354 [Methylomagnum ishizawai]|uniref:Uncharacterized protein n=1 Tax=Methylomagnum ishizawai TaxID=1760988 RepID=A0A1Y6D3P6_9GAMM|nr:hypothetical protein [Methylomagnum ishizawai]SMF95014.1 hypothetical protein SAMN02949497_2354 [Methylomagnum ishizawai]